jgi:hypothetical protein
VQLTARLETLEHLLELVVYVVWVKEAGVVSIDPSRPTPVYRYETLLVSTTPYDNR